MRYYSFIDEDIKITEFTDRQSRQASASTPWENQIKEYPGFIGHLQSDKNNALNNDGGYVPGGLGRPSTPLENRAKEYNVDVNGLMKNDYNVKPKCTYNIQGNIICK